MAGWPGWERGIILSIPVKARAVLLSNRNLWSRGFGDQDLMDRA